MTIADPDKVRSHENSNDKLVAQEDILVRQEDALSIYLQSLLEVPVAEEQVEKTVEKPFASESVYNESITESPNTKPVTIKEVVSKKDVPKEAIVRELVNKKTIVDKFDKGQVVELVPEKTKIKNRSSVEQNTIIARTNKPAKISTIVTAPALEVSKPLDAAKYIEQTNKSQIPDWASTEIKCLSASVGGLTVLIPAEYIESIQNVTNRLKPSEKMPVWIYDLPDEEDEPVQIVNSKKLIFGGMKSHRIESTSRTYAILIDDGAWGLSFDRIGDVVNIKSDDIAWRGESGKRRWLAGTSSGQEAIILDVKKIERALIR